MHNCVIVKFENRASAETANQITMNSEMVIDKSSVYSDYTSLRNPSVCMNAFLIWREDNKFSVISNKL